VPDPIVKIARGGKGTGVGYVHGRSAGDEKGRLARNRAVARMASDQCFSHPDFNRRLWNLTRSTVCNANLSERCARVTGLARLARPTVGGEFHPAPKLDTGEITGKPRGMQCSSALGGNDYAFLGRIQACYDVLWCGSASNS